MLILISHTIQSIQISIAFNHQNIYYALFDNAHRTVLKNYRKCTFHSYWSGKKLLARVLFNILISELGTVTFHDLYCISKVGIINISTTQINQKFSKDKLS